MQHRGCTILHGHPHMRTDCSTAAVALLHCCTVALQFIRHHFLKAHNEIHTACSPQGPNQTSCGISSVSCMQDLSGHSCLKGHIQPHVAYVSQGSYLTSVGTHFSHGPYLTPSGTRLLMSICDPMQHNFPKVHIRLHAAFLESHQLQSSQMELI